jgi:ABC-type multidrug transport system ATPase subunit
VKINVPPVRRGRLLVLNRQEWGFPETTAVIGLLGINGAGKSSFFLSLAGLLMGRETPIVSVGGRTFESFSFLPQAPTLPPWLTAEELAATYSLPFGELEDRFPGLLLAELKERSVSHLSEGQVQTLALALILGADADVTLLDEPLSALDLRRRRGLREYLSQWRESSAGKRLAILSTQNVTEIVDFCDAIVVLHEGECRFCGSVTDLANKNPPGPDALGSTMEDSLVQLLG